MDVLVKKKNPPGTSFGPSGSQLGNQGGVNFIIAEETNDRKENTDTQFRFSNWSYHASLSPFESIEKSWGKY